MVQTPRPRIVKLLAVVLLTGWAAGWVRAQAPAKGSSVPAANPSAAPSLQTPESPDKVVLKVGDQQFTKADLDFLYNNLPPQARQELARQGKKPMGDQFATLVMLSQQARLQHLDQSPEFARRLTLEKQQMEARAEIDQINTQAKVTPEEVNSYYTQHSADYDEITVRQFVIRVKPADARADLTRPSASTGSGLAPDAAKARAEAIRKALLAGTDVKKVMEDFKAPGDVIIDAEPRKIRRGGMRPEMEKVAFALKPGEVSEPVETPQALVFFQVTAQSRLDLKDVSPEIERAMRQEKVNNTVTGIKKSTTVWMDDQYFAAPGQHSQGPTLGTPELKTPPVQ